MVSRQEREALELEEFKAKLRTAAAANLNHLHQAVVAIRHGKPRLAEAHLERVETNERQVIVEVS